MRKGRIIRLTMLALWLVAMGWYVRFEAYPGLFTHTLAGYRDLFSAGELFMDSWMKILFHGKAIGFSHTSVEVMDKDPLEHYRIETRTLLTLNLMGERQNISVQSGGSLDLLQRLQKFSFSLNARRYSMQVDGERSGERQFRVRVKSDLGQSIERIDIPDDVVLYSPMTEMRMGRLAPGDEMRIRTMDPSSMSVGDVIVKALRREPLAAVGRTNDALVLQVVYRGMELTSWVDREGHTLRQDTPLGWSLVACTADEALGLPIDADAGSDLLQAAAVPCRGRWPAAPRERGVHLRLSGAPVDGLPLLQSERQQLLYASNSVAEVRVGTARWPAQDGEPPGTNDLAATAFIQSSHPDVMARAERLVAGLQDPRQKALAIYRWVYENVRKQPTVSLPSALDVLKRMEGDCNEHTYLFVALARAAGIPAQVRVGLLYKDGSMYYHAWPAVHVGGWVEMDPTIGEELVGPEHLTLLRGEMADQLQLMPIFGRLQADVISEP